MSRSFVLSIFFLACVASTTLAFPSKFNKFKVLPKGVQIAPRRATSPGWTLITYTLGYREEGDKLVSQDAISKKFDSLQDTDLTVSYPGENEVGATITYVEIEVEQASSLGQANLLSGGIGQNEISFNIEAYDTYYFNVNYKIYGK